MIALGLLLTAVGSAAPLGACADRAACRFKIGDDAALQEALASLGLVAGELEAAPLKRPGGDLAFAVTLSATLLKVTSLHRAPGVWGEALIAVPALAKPQWKQRATAAAVKAAIGAALEDLQRQIEGVRKVTLSAQINALDAKAREYVERSLLPCLKGLFDLVGPLTEPKAAAGYLDESLQYLPEKDEPRASLEWQAGRVKAAMLGGTRSKCGVANTPLQGWSTSVTADPLNGAVVVSWKR